MKKLLFTILIGLNTQLASLPNIKNIFNYKKVETLDQIELAILNSDVDKVLTLLNKNTSLSDLQHYLYLCECNFGRAPKASVQKKLLGTVKFVLGISLFYKTMDYFKQELGKTGFNVKTRYNNVHTILMDIAGLSGFISCYGFVLSAVNIINPHSNHKKQLLIRLYLDNLIKNNM